MNKNAPVARIYTPQEVNAAKEQAETRKQEIHDAAHAEGVKHGMRVAERYKGLAYAFIGFVLGCLFTGVYTSTITNNTTFTTGAVVDSVLQHTVTPTPANVPLAPRVTATGDYQSNAEDARQAACREGVRGACSRGP